MLVIGHRKNAKGTQSPDGLTNEYDYSSVLVPRVATILEARGHKVTVIERPERSANKVGPYQRMINAVKGIDADCVVSSHVNGALSPYAQGTEVIVSGSAASRRLGQCLLDAVVPALKTHDRGLKTVQRDGRGGPLLWGVPQPAAILEPGFLTSRYDLHRLRLALEDGTYALAFAEGVDNYLKTLEPTCD